MSNKGLLSPSLAHGTLQRNVAHDMPDREPAPKAAIRPLWAGRAVPLLGIILIGLSLRHAITGVTPLLGTIKFDLEMGNVGATLLGMLPTIIFGVAGFITPAIIRITSLPLVAVAAMSIGALGTLARAVAPSPDLFLIASAVTLFGLGMGNVVGPPLVKRYFPDRQAAAMSLLVLTMQAGATFPAALAVPIANMHGWRIEVGLYAAFMVVAALPWLITLSSVRTKRSTATQAPATVTYSFRDLIRNSIAVGAALFYGIAALNTYAMLAWLPSMLNGLGMTTGQSANVFSIYTLMTLPMALILPQLASRLKDPTGLGLFLSVTSAVGYLGLILAPLSTAPIWAVFAGLSGGAFPFAMIMFNKRCRTSDGSAAITGFGMGFGYAFGTVGPLLGGALSSATDSWRVPLAVFALTAIPMAIGAVMLTRPRFFEDQTPIKRH